MKWLAIIAHMVNKDFFVNYLKELFPDAVCELKFNSTFELLISVILSAQCTDKRVNMVTERLFKIANTPQAFVDMPIEELEKHILPCGFYKNKAKHIKECSKSLVENFGGVVPSTKDELTSLAGVGNKTANVVLSVAFGQNFVAVDTHVLRVSNRLGFVKTLNPDICEKTLIKLFKVNLDKLHYRMVLFGRYYCKARNPECETCKLKDYCYHFKKNGVK